MLFEDIQNKIVSRLKLINPRKIILFGSYAKGCPGKDSDIDLLVVTNDDFIPDSFFKKNEIYLNVSNAIVDIEKTVPIDLIVHTKAMHEKFNDLGGMFSRKIVTEGIILYEKTDS